MRRVCFLLAAWLAGWALTPAVHAAEAVPATGSVSTTPVPTRYILKPNDKIQLSVYDEPDLATAVFIDENGNALFPLIDSVAIGGKSVEEATQAIRAAYAKDYLVDPKVRLEVLEHAKRTFSIIGFVKTPGLYEIPTGESISLVQAILMAGGGMPSAKLTNVRVMRPVSGEQNRDFPNLNVLEMIRNPKVQTFQVFAGDTIEVRDKLL